jgi:hypothetical protein
MSTIGPATLRSEGVRTALTAGCRGVPPVADGRYPVQVMSAGRCIRWLVPALATAALPGICACSPSALRGGFDSPNSASKLYAIERAARANDQSAIPRIIEQLDSDDPAVRMIAISALERLTGQTHGYEYWAPRVERDRAVETWVRKHARDGAIGGIEEVEDSGDGRSPALVDSNPGGVDG